MMNWESTHSRKLSPLPPKKKSPARDYKAAASLTDRFIDRPITVTTVIKNHLFGGGPIVD